MEVATKTIKTDKQLIPALRFKEFEDEWGKKKMGDLSERIGDGLHGTPKYVDESDIHFVNGNNLINGNIFITDKTKKVDENTFLKNDKNLSDNTLLISLNGTIGNIARYNNEKVMLGKSVGYFNFNTDSEYYYHILKSPKIQRFFISELTGSTIKNLSLKTLRETIIPFPSLPEQQKIASFLSAVDEKIQQLTKKKELLEQYKKGVMQQLFSGQLRLKDENGNPYPYWEEKRLGEVGNIVSGLTYSPDDIDESGVLVLRSSNVHGRQVTFDDNVYVNVIDGKFNPVEENDVLICVRNGSKRLIGKNALIKGKAIGVAFGAFMTVYRSASNLFLFHYFDTVDYKKEVHKNLGATINSINGSDLKKFKIPFPCEEEQQKIARYLSSIDTKIESVNNGITLTQTFKKGLLQQLFV